MVVMVLWKQRRSSKIGDQVERVLFAIDEIVGSIVTLDGCLC